MNWLWSILAALLAAVTTGLGAFALGLGIVAWYQVSSFEGKSAFMVVYAALLGALAGGVIGLVVARLAVAGGHPGLMPQMLAAVGTPATLLVLVAIVAWWNGDPPPTHEGRPLEVLVEIRLPADAAALPMQANIAIGSVSGGTMSRRREGSLLLDEARREDDRWILPARLPLFTRRGTPVMMITLDDHSNNFSLNLAKRRPAEANAEWSPWLPYARPDGQPPASPVTYRFRVATEQ